MFLAFSYRIFSCPATHFSRLSLFSIITTFCSSTKPAPVSQAWLADHLYCLALFYSLFFSKQILDSFKKSH